MIMKYTIFASVVALIAATEAVFEPVGLRASHEKNRPYSEGRRLADELSVVCPADSDLHTKDKVIYSGPKWIDSECCDEDKWWPCAISLQKRCADEPDPSLYFAPKYALFDKLLHGTNDHLAAIMNLMWSPIVVEIIESDPSFQSTWNKVLDKVQNGNLGEEREWVIENLACTNFVEDEMQDKFSELMRGLKATEKLMGAANFRLLQGSGIEEVVELFENVLGKLVPDKYEIAQSIVNYHIKRIKTTAIKTRLIMKGEW